MKNLFEKWKEKIPKYHIVFRETLFEKLTRTGGGGEQGREDRGKQFSNNYELYIYAFFFGLYKDEYSPISEGSRKIDFSMPIKTWGSKTNVLGRKDFTNLQENMFISLLAKTDIDLVALEKGELDEDDAVKLLIKTMESYTNGGLILIKEKLEENPNYFLQPTSFVNMILETAD
ncbi:MULTISPECIES: hypothetical protein [Aequorivita]|uniref:Glycoside hydrolase family 15 n=1 Tax=Aequorivita iocasae TaxID=2803865 RepID=A0ABX7DQA8_9FLAO|nr:MULTISPECIES: hypothetical protein [Aequorivita]QQX76002.1 hypothetical protein JK629_11740 [Aequorivita iocasae]UCA55463.1 hypothetical protein LDL78_11795 [Aequorivita sp. F7]